MPFGTVSGIGRGISVLDGGGDRQRESGSFGSDFEASHCNQWGLATRLFPNYFGQLAMLPLMKTEQKQDV